MKKSIKLLITGVSIITLVVVVFSNKNTNEVKEMKKTEFIASEVNDNLYNYILFQNKSNYFFNVAFDNDEDKKFDDDDIILFEDDIDCEEKQVKEYDFDEYYSDRVINGDELLNYDYEIEYL